MSSSAIGESAKPAIRPRLVIAWVHNTPKTLRTFVSDILSALPESLVVTETILPLRPSLYSLRTLIRTFQKAATQAEIVHAQFGSLPGLVASFTSKPFLLTLRGTDFYRMPSSTLANRIESLVRQIFTFLACMRADVIVVMSHRMRRELRKWPFLGQRQIVVVTDPIGSEFWKFRQFAIDETAWRTTPFHILVGSLESTNRVKRIWIIEDAIALCNAAGMATDVKVLSGLPRCELPLKIIQADLIALTSIHEGWPNIIKEGLVLGVSFVATDVSDLADHCGRQLNNHIVDATPLDISLAIVDALALKITKDPLSKWLPAVVGLKHEIIYRYLQATSKK
jgi:hypothetical protein